MKYNISDSKKFAYIISPKNLKRLLTESYCFNTKSEIVKAYLSNNVGVFITNLSTNITEKFLTTNSLKYLDILIDKDFSYILFYIDNSNNCFIKRLNKTTNNYETIQLNISCNRGFLTTYKDKILLLYKNINDNYIYRISNEDDFTSTIITESPNLYKQDISIVYEDNNTLTIITEVIDNTLLLDLPKYPTYMNKSYIQIPIKIQELEQQV